MKELSQEEKAKRYDELLLKLQKAKVDDNVCDEMYYRVIDDIVPELKESEDEKIRESIIENLKGNMCRTDGDYDLLNKQIAWLEKQGEQKQDPCEHCDDKRLNCHNFPCVKKKAFEQGKSVLEAIKEEPQVYDTEDGEIITYYETDGYKLVGPKFKKGDWIVNKFGDVWHIDSFDNKNYQVSDGKGNYNYFPISKQDKMRLWTIQDAKAGDVLYSPKGAGVEGIFLIKGWEQVELTGKTLCSSIGYRVEENEIVVSGLGAIWWEGVVDPFYPATKEQRDKFEKAMADAGYTFDFDKKKLKKVEQKPAWSEEDKMIALSIEQVMNCASLLNIVPEKIDKIRTWLKSLKGRVGCEANCTTTKEWSEEDECCINQLIVFCENCMVSDSGAKRCAHWLKSLKQRYNWKPSDEQMDALEYHLKHTNENSRLYKDTKKLYEQLKKLK